MSWTQMRWHGGPHMTGWGWLIMGIGMLVFWAVVITLLVLLVRSLLRQRSGASQSYDRGAEQILAERFARGEIDAGEYQARIKVLRRGAGPSAGDG